MTQSAPENLKITLIQSDVYWHNIDANLAMFEEKIWQINEPTDLIVLPEMFNTGFTQEAAAWAEPMNSKTFRWMRQQAAQTKAVVTGSYIVKESGKYFNRLVWMEPAGTFATYDKRHLFRMSDEHLTFSAGNSLLTCNLKGWKICPLVCYDLRFPVWSRNKINSDHQLQYDVLLYVANWPAARSIAWFTLLQARAIENLSYTVGVNRVGEDGNHIRYDGKSAVISPQGKVLLHEENAEFIQTITLDYKELAEFRNTFAAYLDSDVFTLADQQKTE